MRGRPYDFTIKKAPGINGAHVIGVVIWIYAPYRCCDWLIRKWDNLRLEAVLSDPWSQLNNYDWSFAWYSANAVLKLVVNRVRWVHWGIQKHKTAYALCVIFLLKVEELSQNTVLTDRRPEYTVDASQVRDGDLRGNFALNLAKPKENHRE